MKPFDSPNCMPLLYLLQVYGFHTDCRNYARGFIHEHEFNVNLNDLFTLILEILEMKFPRLNDWDPDILDEYQRPHRGFIN